MYTVDTRTDPIQKIRAIMDRRRANDPFSYLERRKEQRRNVKG